MDHTFKIGDVVKFKSGSPDLTVLSIGPQSVSVACYDEEALAKGIAINYNGTYFHGDLELVAGVNTEAKASRSKSKKKVANPLPEAKKD